MLQQNSAVADTDILCCYS